MTRQDFVDYLEQHGCETVRVDKQGYNVMRKIETKNISALPVTDPPLNATVCRICKTLDVETPKIAISAKGIIEEIHQKFNNGC